jgi:hypothetical protein
MTPTLSKTLFVLSVFLLAAANVFAQGPRGTVPRTKVEHYAVHAVRDGNSIGATLLTPSKVKQEFSTDLDDCCLTVEVAIYPRKDGMLEVSLNDFALREVGKDIASKPSSAEVVAGRLQRRTQPDQPGDRDVIVSPRAGIGYENGGIDPATGQRRGGVITSTGVDVAVGVPRSPQPASGEADRRTMTLELREKSLPEGSTASPVAGYLYFTMPKKKKVKYQLEYMLNGTRVVLPL